MKQEYPNIEDIIRLLNFGIEICFVNRNSQTSKYFTENGQFLKDLVLRNQVGFSEILRVRCGNCE